MFTQARIKLTLWYVVLILSISTSLSLAIYWQASTVITRQHQRMQQRFNAEPLWRQEQRQPPPFMAEIFTTELVEAKKELATKLIIINLGLGSFVALASYFLSGITLKPIKDAMDQQKIFISNAAHQLKTPITAMKTAQQVALMDSKLNKTAKHVLTENLNDLDRLQSLSESLLAISAHQQLTISKHHHHLDELVSQVISSLKSLASSKQITINSKIPQKTAIYVDNFFFKEMLSALLDNAIKYSPPKSTIILSGEQTKNSTTITIKDHGIGIEPNNLPNVFNRFFRAAPADIAGSGLGLSLVQDIVNSHHGKITLDSVPNQGTTITVAFPKA